ncbi:MAG: hypothetical protein NVS3B17_07560 [Vulcanimicrobiaceae bacterium]
MQRDRLAVAATWLRTARRDLELARSIVEREASLSAFHAQQAAEKALKALAVATIDDHPRTHTAGRIVRELRELDASIDVTIERDASALDLFCLTSRYPDTIGDEDPGDVIAAEDAAIAVERADRVVAFVVGRLAALAR